MNRKKAEVPGRKESKKNEDVKYDSEYEDDLIEDPEAEEERPEEEEEHNEDFEGLIKAKEEKKGKGSKGVENEAGVEDKIVKESEKQKHHNVNEECQSIDEKEPQESISIGEKPQKTNSKDEDLARENFKDVIAELVEQEKRNSPLNERQNAEGSVRENFVIVQEEPQAKDVMAEFVRQESREQTDVMAEFVRQEEKEEEEVERPKSFNSTKRFFEEKNGTIFGQVSKKAADEKTPDIDKVALWLPTKSSTKASQDEKADIEEANIQR